MGGFDNKLFIVVTLVLYILAVTYIGYRNRQNSNSEEYFLASRKMPAWLLAITFIASWWGGGSAIDLVDHAMRDGISTFWIYGVPVLLATFLMFIFAAAIRRVSTISQSELLENRYDGRSALMLTLFIVVFMVIGAAIQIIVVAQFFSSFFDISYSMSAILGTSLVLLYSLFGGFKGVVLTDLFQFVFFLFASCFLFYLAYDGSGGFENAFDYARSQNKDGYTNFMHNIGDNIAYVLTFGTSWMIQANVWQRISAARTPKSARSMMLISFVSFIPLYMMVTLTGMLALPMFGEVPQGGVVSSLLIEYGDPIVSGLIFVGLCSAIMSTMDSMFNAGALSLTVDLYKRYLRPASLPSHYVAIGRYSTLLIAVVALLIATQIKSVLTISWIGADFLASGAFVPLVAGFLWRGGTSTAAFYSMVFGFLFSSYNLAVALGVPLPTAWEIASAQQAIYGIGASLLLFVTISLLTKGDTKKADQFIKMANIIKSRTNDN